MKRALRPGIDHIPETCPADIRRTDGQARQILGTSPGGYKDEVTVLAHLSTPLAVVYGEQDQLINRDYNRDYVGSLAMPSLLWRDGLQIIPDAGHVAHWEQPAVFNPLFEAFITETAK